MRLGDLVVKFIADMGDWDGGVQKAQKDIGETGEKTETLGKKSRIAGDDMVILAGGVMAAGALAYSASEKYGSMAQQLKDLSFQTGLSVEDLQHLQYACVLSGTDASIMAAGFNKLTLTMADAKDPTSEAYKAFMGLGIDPTGKTPKQVFDLTAVALVNMKDETDRNAAAMAIYGKNWKELLPYMDTYIKNKKEIEKSPVLTQKELDDLDLAKQRWDKLTNSLTIYSGKILAFLDRTESFIEKNSGVFHAMGAVFSLASGESPDFSDWNLPKMASGGIVTKPTIAMIGEAGPEAVIPLSGAGGGMGDIIIKDCVFGSDPKQTARELYALIEQRNRGRGSGS
jgi:hypothetical protein